MKRDEALQKSNTAMDEPVFPGFDEDQSAYDVKELFIEACVREWRAENFSEVVGLNNLEAMSMLNPSSLKDAEDGASLYSGPDLFSSLYHDICSEERERWLRKHVSSCLQDKNLKEQVGVYLDEDLKAAGILGIVGPGRLADKARAIGSYRLKQHITSMPLPGQAADASTKTFRVTLKTLSGGHGGLPRENNLYFNYGTSFPTFQVILRDATRLSKIPPIDLEGKMSADRETSLSIGSDIASQSSSTQDRRGSTPSFGGASERGSQSSREPSKPLYQDPSSNALYPPIPRNATDRGYTTADGPWRYRLICATRNDLSRDYGEVKDEQTYRKMVNHFQEVSRKDPDNRYTISMIHDIDRRAILKWKQKEAEDERAEQQFYETSQRELLVSADAAGDVIHEGIKEGLKEWLVQQDVGEGYMDWLRKDLERLNKNLQVRD